MVPISPFSTAQVRTTTKQWLAAGLCAKFPPKYTVYHRYLYSDCSFISGRCGSTVTAAMLYKTGQAVVHAEPGVLRDFLFLHRDNKIPLTSSVTHDIAADMLRLMSPDVTKTYVIKPKPNFDPMLKAALPGIREVFIYRNLRSNAQSWKNIGFADIGNIEKNKELYDDPLLQSKNIAVFKKHGDPWFDLDQTKIYRILVAISSWAAEHDSGKDHVFQYEELVNDPTDYATRMLTACNIDVCHVPAALTALDQDSQKNSTVSRGKTPKFVPISDRAMRIGRRIAEDMGLVMDDAWNITF